MVVSIRAADRKPTNYVAKKFDFGNVVGLSKRALELHQSLYEGYVRETNSLLPLVSRHSETDPSSETRLVRDGLVRRFAFEYNGMVLHELFFDALRGKSSPPSAKGSFSRLVGSAFGNLEVWRNEVKSLAQTRGVGWVITAQQRESGTLFNAWIDEHHHGLPADWRPIVVFDLWEHAFLLDFKPTERSSYLDTLFDNLDWKILDERCR